MSFEERFVRFVLESARAHGNIHDHEKASELLAEFNEMTSSHRGPIEVEKPEAPPSGGTQTGEVVDEDIAGAATT